MIIFIGFLDNRQQTTDNRQQTTDNRQPTTTQGAGFGIIS
jgi:hypothetical protein